MFFVAALIICLIIKFRFPKGKSIATFVIIYSICFPSKSPDSSRERFSALGKQAFVIANICNNLLKYKLP